MQDKHKVFILVIFLILIFSLIAIVIFKYQTKIIENQTHNDAQNLIVNQYKTFTDFAGDYEVSVPQSWYINTINESSYSFNSPSSEQAFQELIVKNENIEDGAREDLIITKFASVSQFLKNEKSSATTLIQYFENTSTIEKPYQLLNINGLQAYQVKRGDFGLKEEFYILGPNKALYILSFNQIREPGKDYSQRDKIINSFKVREQTTNDK